MVQKTLVRLFVAASVLFGAGVEVARAQQPCAEFMKFGIYDEYDTLSVKKNFELFQKWFCSHEFSTQADAEREATNAGLDVIEIFTFGFGNDRERMTWSEWKRQMCAADFSAISRDATYVNRIRQISPALMKVLKTCLEGNTPGFRAWVNTSRDRTQVTFNTKYIPVVREVARVRTFVVTPRAVMQRCDPLSEVARNAEIDSGGSSITCEVDPRSTLTFTINTSGGRAAISLDPYVPPPPTPAPTATITASPTRVTRGQTTTLVWTSQYASEVNITGVGNGVPALGSLQIAPQQSTTYTITAKAPGGVSTTASVAVEVIDPLPTIDAWSSSNSIVIGQTAVLSWNAPNGSVSIDPDIGAVQLVGTRSVNPQQTTKYTFTVTNGTQTATKSLDVVVNPKIRVWIDVGLTGNSKIDLNGPGSILFGDQTSASSIEIFTDEWVTFRSKVIGGPLDGGFPKQLTLIVKGPKRISDLRIYPTGGRPLGNFNDILNTVVVLQPANGPSPAVGTYDLIIP